MNLFHLKTICLFLALSLTSTTGYAWTTFSDKKEGFQADFPCKVQTQQVNQKDKFFKTYSCEESVSNSLLLYQVTLAGRVDGKPLKYRKGDINLALKNFIIGNLAVYGANTKNIEFHEVAKFMNKYPAIYYYTNSLRGGITAEGLSCLIKGKHCKIGIIYEPLGSDIARKRFQHFLNSYQLN